jgi:transketolase
MGHESIATGGLSGKEIDPKRLQLAIDTIKTLSIDAVQKANSGHPGTPMGLADITSEIYLRYLKYDPKDPNWIGRDRFVLSCGHASMLAYSVLHLAGYDLPMSELQAFRQWDSRTPGHPEWHHTVGIETTTGPLGQGICNAIGLALGAKMMEARFGEPFAGQNVFCICSDGDVMEGVSGEASSIAGHLGISNLVVFYDDNKITIEGETELAFSEDVGMRYEAYGWYVQRIDGHNHKEIRRAIDHALAQHDRPSFIVARTHIANGSPHAHDTAEAHGAPLGDKEIAATKTNIGWDPAKSFFVPDDVYGLFKERAADNAKAKSDWETRYAAWRKANGDLAKQLDTMLEKKTPDDLYQQLLKAVPEKEDATRNTSNAIQQVAAKLCPSLVGGSADLAPSTKTLIKGADSVSRGHYAGRNFHFGIREHGMAAVVNGLALYGGLIPYGATFFIFSDYMRPAVRLSALMGIRAIWIWTHDSVFLGEDGPTHQPIEHYWAMRLIPNFELQRPCDSIEVAAAWTAALTRKDGPTGMCLTRQKLPNWKRDAGFDMNDILKGAYVLREASGGKPEMIIMATGSEVHLAMGARDVLEKAGKKVRVVSAPCMERFGKQDAAYRNAVLPDGVRKVSIESGRTPPWLSVIGEHGLAIGIDHYGASAPAEIIAEKFGLTVDSVVRRIQAWVG